MLARPLSESRQNFSHLTITYERRLLPKEKKFANSSQINAKGEASPRAMAQEGRCRGPLKGPI